LTDNVISVNDISIRANPSVANTESKADRAANRVNDSDYPIINAYLYIQERNVFRTYGTCGGGILF
tara:strand:- start:4082 stop:4279 length:198 start_codon:yes stop_codon:yes gene_type:complete